MKSTCGDKQMQFPEKKQKNDPREIFSIVVFHIFCLQFCQQTEQVFHRFPMGFSRFLLDVAHRKLTTASNSAAKKTSPYAESASTDGGQALMTINRAINHHEKP